jgi:hypothetical protein
MKPTSVSSPFSRVVSSSERGTQDLPRWWGNRQRVLVMPRSVKRSVLKNMAAPAAEAGRP